MSFVINPGTVQTPLTAGGIAYGTGSQVKVNSAGTAGQVLLSNGASTPTWGTISSGAQSFVATGSITAGVNVALNSNGTVSIVTGSVGAYTVTRSAGVSDSTILNSSQIDVAYDPVKNIVAVIYALSGSGYVNVIIGEISGSAITFPAGAYQISSSYNYGGVSVAYDGTAKCFVFGYSPVNSIYFRAGTYSGGTLTVGGVLVAFNSGTASQLGMTYDSSAGGVVAAWAIGTTQMKANFLTTSTTTITNQSVCSVSIGGTLNIPYQNGWGSLAYDETSLQTQVYFTNTDGYIWYNLIKVTGNTISAASAQGGTAVIGSTYPQIRCCYVKPFGGVVISYVLQGAGDLSGVFSRIGTVSSSTITLSAVATISSGSNDYIGQGIAYNASTLQLIYFYYLQSDSTVRYKLGTFVGSTVTWGSQQSYLAASIVSNSKNLPAVYVSGSTKGIVQPYQDSPASNVYASFLNAALTTNYSNWIGLAAQTVTTGQTLNVTTIGGVNTSVTGLTIQSKYYCDPFGNFTTSSTDNVEVGKAIGTTKMYVTNGAA